jgi:protease-4
MNQIYSVGDESSGVKTIVIQQPGAGWRGWLFWLLMVGLGLSLMFNLMQLVAFSDYAGGTTSPYEKYHSGELTSSSKIARIVVGVTIMPPYTDRLLASIKKAAEDDSVKGVLLVIDSPGGLVSDSHKIYHKLKLLSDKKPVYVAFQGIAASGGYYVAMGAGPKGRIYAEPTTWTGSIGVIIPHYNVSELATKVGVSSDSLKTGPFKDALNPLKEMTPDEKAVWEEILKDSFDRFIQVIDEGRSNLDEAGIRKLATGQVFTAPQALQNGLVDAIGYEDEALTALQQAVGLTDARVIEYEHPQTLSDILLGGSAQSRVTMPDPLTAILESSVPRAMYLFGWHPGIANGH